MEENKMETKRKVRSKYVHASYPDPDGSVDVSTTELDDLGMLVEAMEYCENMLLHNGRLYNGRFNNSEEAVAYSSALRYFREKLFPVCLEDFGKVDCLRFRCMPKKGGTVRFTIHPYSEGAIPVYSDHYRSFPSAADRVMDILGSLGSGKPRLSLETIEACADQGLHNASSTIKELQERYGKKYRLSKRKMDKIRNFLEGKTQSY